MGDAARQGRTILFVSHNMAAVERLCDRVLVLERGSVRFTGTAEDAVRQYLQLNEATKVTWARADDHPISHPHFTRAWLTGANGDKAAAVTSAAKLGIAVEFRIPQRVPALHLAVAVCNEEKIPIFATVPEDSRLECPRAEGLYRTCVWLPQGLLMPRRYHIVLSLYMPGEPFDQIPAALTFEVAEVASLYNLIPGGRVGEVQIVCSWEPFAPLNTGNMA
jgi:lipopolysaccharide transport system ATP-binding protein